MTHFLPSSPSSPPFDAISISLDSSSEETLPCDASILLSLSYSLLEYEPLKREPKNDRLLCLVNGATDSATSNNSTDLLLTFVLSEGERKQDLHMEESPSPKSTKTLKLLMKLHPLTRSNLMPHLLRKKSVTFPLSGLEDVVFFRKHDTPLSVSTVPSSDDDLEEDLLNNQGFDDILTHTTGKHLDTFGSGFFVAPPVPTFWRVSGLNMESMLVSQKRFFSDSDEKVVGTSSAVQLKAVTVKRLLLGGVLVKNLAFEKLVSVRYTDDGWDSFRETKALYVKSLDPTLDKFQFEIDLDSLKPDVFRTDLEFCVKYSVGNETYWDSNEGHNYNVHLTRHMTRRHKKQVSESNVLQFNSSRIFPEDHIDVWFKKGPSNNFAEGFRERPSVPTTLWPMASEFSALKGQTSYNELVANYCFYGGEKIRTQDDGLVHDL